MAAESDPFEHTRMTLGEHLAELRVRLFKGVLAVVVAFCVGMFFQDPLVEVVSRPFERAAVMLRDAWREDAVKAVEVDPSKAEELFEDGWPEVVILRKQVPHLVAIGPGESFVYGLKVVFYFSLVFGGPVLLWQLWQFIAAGLYKHEKRHIYTYFPLSLLMATVGILFGYFLMVPYAIFFLNIKLYAEMTVTTSAYLTFLTGLCLAFGVVFQLPLVMTFLSRAGVVEVKTYTKYRGHFIVIAFVVAAILTPPDPVTQTMLGVPLVILYEIGILGSRAAVKRSRELSLVPSEGAP